MKNQDKLAKVTPPKVKPQALTLPPVDVADPAQVIVLGKIGSAYGLEGWVKILSYTQPRDNILTYSNCMIGNPNRWHQIKLTHARAHGKGFVGHFEGFDSPEIARQLTNLLIGTTRDQLPETENDEYYWHDLIGLSVVNLNNECLGNVTTLFDSGPHDILVIKGEKEHLIPYVKDVYIKSVNMKDRTIIVDWQPDSFTYGAI